MAANGPLLRQTGWDGIEYAGRERSSRLEGVEMILPGDVRLQSRGHRKLVQAPPEPSTPARKGKLSPKASSLAKRRRSVLKASTAAKKLAPGLGAAAEKGKTSPKPITAAKKVAAGLGTAAKKGKVLPKPSTAAKEVAAGLLTPAKKKVVPSNAITAAKVGVSGPRASATKVKLGLTAGPPAKEEVAVGLSTPLKKGKLAVKASARAVEPGAQAQAALSKVAVRPRKLAKGKVESGTSTPAGNGKSSPAMRAPPAKGKGDPKPSSQAETPPKQAPVRISDAAAQAGAAVKSRGRTSAAIAAALREGRNAERAALRAKQTRETAAPAPCPSSAA